MFSSCLCNFRFPSPIASLTPVLGEEFLQNASMLWEQLQAIIEPSECDVFTYCGDSQDDPFTEEGTTWSMVFLLYNKKLKRIVLFTVTCLSFSAAPHSQENEDDLPEDLLFQEVGTEFSDHPDDDMNMY
eukprot:m.175781 g.175781  ORF g.175781 m.175781 type:complete len:129 (+) comp16550_c3_seq3:755-1141(+)